MLNMMPFFQQRQQQNPFLTLAAAANPQVQPQFPGYSPQPPAAAPGAGAQPYVPQPYQQPQTLPSLPQPDPYNMGTLPSMPEADTRSGIRRQWDEGMQKVQSDLESGNTSIMGWTPSFNPAASGPAEKPSVSGLDLPSGGDMWSWIKKIYDVKPAGEPEIGSMVPTGDPMGGSFTPYWGDMKPKAPTSPAYGGMSPDERDESTAPSKPPVAPSDSGVSSILSALGLGSDFGAGVPGQTPLAPVPEFGPYPNAPHYASPDFTEADRYLEAARPTAPEADQKEIGMAMLMGAMRGFTPYGSVGEILGGMAAPGAEAGWAERKEDQALQRQYESDLRQWNASMGTEQGRQAQVLTEAENANAQAEYQNAVGKYEDAINRWQLSDERSRWQAGIDLQRAQLGLSQAQLKLQAALGMARIQRLGQGQGQMTYAALQDAIHKGAQYGWLPGIDMQAVRTGALQEMLADPNWGEQRQFQDPQGFARELDRRAFDSISRSVMADPELMNQVLMFASKPKGAGTAEDFIDALSGDY